ncbi:hypothetical protein ACLB1Q_17910 [Escherichia coli]
MNPLLSLRYDAQGRRLDDVRFHPAWHLLMYTMYQSGAQSCLGEDARSGAFVARAVRFMLHAQVRRGRYVQ